MANVNTHPVGFNIYTYLNIKKTFFTNKTKYAPIMYNVALAPFTFSVSEN